MKKILTIYLLLTITCATAKEDPPGRRLFLPVQYAGSIGLFSAGLGSTFREEKLDLSLMYGFLPRNKGGSVHTITLKFGYTPFRFRAGDRISLAPFTIGCFFAQHFNSSLSTKWDTKYPKGYYWWPRNLRQHLFIRSAVSLTTGSKIKQLSLYFEINTNDLYLYSYLPNTRALGLHQILFFGTGIALFIR